MELIYLKLTDIYKINIYDLNELIQIDNSYKDFFSSKKISYKKKIKTESDNNSSINFYIIEKNLNKSNINIYDNISNNKNIVNIVVDIDKNIIEIYDKINFNYLRKVNYLNNNGNNLLKLLTDYFKISTKIINLHGKFSLPVGYLKELDLKLGFNNSYFLSKSKTHKYNLKLLNDKINDKYISINLKVLKCQRQKYKYINHTYFLLYIQTLNDLDLKYFCDCWFYSKFIHHLKSVFNVKASQPEIYIILNKIVRNALEKKSPNTVYNKYKFFINNLELYNNFLFNLYDFKTTCKRIVDAEIKYKSVIETLEDKVPINSLDFYTSKVSYSNWVENLEIGSYFGLLVNGNYKRKCLEGLQPSIFIKNINQSVLCLDDYIANYEFYYKKNGFFDDGRKSSTLIDYDGIGRGNIFLPVYISSEHFNIITKNIKIITGINIYQNPMRFKKENLLIYITILSNLIKETFCNKDCNTEKWYNIFFNYLIFVKEIININFTNQELLNLFSQHINGIKFNKDFVIGIYVLLKINNIQCDDKYKIITKILEEEIRLLLGKHCTDLSKAMPQLFDLNYTNFNKFLEKLDEKHIINSNIINNFQNMINQDVSFMKNIWSFDRFIRFFVDKVDSFYETINNSYGLLNKDQITEIRNIINENKFPEENDTINGILNPLFETHIIYNKTKVINILSITQKIFSDNKKLNCDSLNIQAMILQGILQRNFNKRKMALNSIKKGKIHLYIDPNKFPRKCIHNCLKIFFKIWSLTHYGKIKMRLSSLFRTTTDIKILSGIFFILNTNNNLKSFITDCIKDGKIKNLSLKLDILENGHSFIDKRYLWLLPKNNYKLILATI